jgi:hypothetical protein
LADVIAFTRGEHNFPHFEARDDSYSAIGSMLTSDVQYVEIWCLRILAWIEDVSAGRSTRESWEGNSWSAELTAKGLHLQDHFSDDWQGDYALAEAHDIVLKYLTFLAPGPGQKETAIAEWEAETGRSHPCRGHI